MTSEGASTLLLPDRTLNVGMPGSPCRVLPFLIPQPVQQPPWEMIRLSHLETSVFNHGSPLVQLPFHMNPLVKGAEGHDPRNPEPGKGLIQAGPELKFMSSAQKQRVIPTKATQNWAATEPLPGAACYPASLVLTSTLKKNLMPTTASSVTQAAQGGPAPRAPPPVLQVGHIVLPSKDWPQNLWIPGNIGVALAQNKALHEESCSSHPSVYQNFRRWQYYKPLAQLYIPQTPDMEALACFLIPVLRSLTRLKPTMTLEEGLGRAIREWQHTKNYERMIFYDMAAKFMEFEAEEEMQCKNGAQGLLAPTNTKPESQGALAPAVGQQPACVPRNTGLQTLAACPKTQKVQHIPRTQGPFEDLSDAVEGYLDLMDEFLKAPTLETSGKEQEQEAEPWSDPDLLSYLDELCSQEDFVTKVEAVIHPQFLAYLLSQDPQLDFSALAEKLEEEAGLMPSQLVEKRLLGHKDNGAKKTRPPYHVIFKKTSLSAGVAGSSAPTPTQGHRPGSSTSACTAKTDCGYVSRPELAETPMLAPEASALDQSPCPNLFLPTVDNRDTFLLGQAPPGRGMSGPTEQANEEEEAELSSLAFLQTSQPSLLPWGLALSPAPASDPRCPRGREGLSLCSPKRRGQEGFRPRAPKRKTSQLSGPAAVPSKKHRVCVGPASRPVKKTPRLDETPKKCGALSVLWDCPINPAERWLQPVVVLRRMKIPGIP